MTGTDAYRLVTLLGKLDPKAQLRLIAKVPPESRRRLRRVCRLGEAMSRQESDVPPKEQGADWYSRLLNLDTLIELPRSVMRWLNSSPTEDDF